MSLSHIFDKPLHSEFSGRRCPVEGNPAFQFFSDLLNTSPLNYTSHQGYQGYPTGQNLLGQFGPLRDVLKPIFSECLPVDMWSENGSYHIKVNIPGGHGVGDENLKVTCEDSNLTVTVKSCQEVQETQEVQPNQETQQEVVSDKTYLLRERTQNELSRTISLPDDANTDYIRAELENGVLYLIVHKAKKSKRKVVPVSRPNRSSRPSQVVCASKLANPTQSV